MGNIGPLSIKTLLFSLKMFLTEENSRLSDILSRCKMVVIVIECYTAGAAKQYTISFRQLPMCHFPFHVNSTAVACWIFLDVIFGNLVGVTRLESEAFEVEVEVSGLQTLFWDIRIDCLFFPRHYFYNKWSEFQRPWITRKKSSFKKLLTSNSLNTKKCNKITSNSYWLRQRAYWFAGLRERTLN